VEIYAAHDYNDIRMNDMRACVREQEEVIMNLQNTVARGHEGDAAAGVLLQLMPCLRSLS